MMLVSKSGTLHDLCEDKVCPARDSAKALGKRFAGSLTAQASGLVKKLCKTCFTAGEWPTDA